mmetsp:Transcript_24534/g.62570  ORF Transcript_24534/g.62570 Transcript_24534/m.62570 type:complete len:210 (+) Transcript_24534:260-889(+)
MPLCQEELRADDGPPHRCRSPAISHGAARARQLALSSVISSARDIQVSQVSKSPSLHASRHVASESLDARRPCPCIRSPRPATCTPPPSSLPVSLSSRSRVLARRVRHLPSVQRTHLNRHRTSHAVRRTPRAARRTPRTWTRARGRERATDEPSHKRRVVVVSPPASRGVRCPETAAMPSHRPTPCPTLRRRMPAGARAPPGARCDPRP